jgi:hypothetical protein
MSRIFEDPDGIPWRVEVTLPGASNALVIFHHPGGRTARLDRYNWYNAETPEARSVTARLDPKTVLESITDAQLALLFRRSMPITAPGTPLGHPAVEPAV